MWCCKTTKEECIRSGDDMNEEVICDGIAMSLNDQCHEADYNAHSCNYFPTDEYRNYGNNVRNRSHIDLCLDNRYTYLFTTTYN